MWRLIDELKRSAFGPTRGRSEESRRDGPPVLPIRLWPGCAPVGTGVPSTRLRSLPVSLSSFSFNPSLSLPRVHHRDRKRERERARTRAKMIDRREVGKRQPATTDRSALHGRCSRRRFSPRGRVRAMPRIRIDVCVKQTKYETSNGKKKFVIPSDYRSN